MQKKMENEMEAGITVCRGYTGLPSRQQLSPAFNDADTSGIPPQSLKGLTYRSQCLRPARVPLLFFAINGCSVTKSDARTTIQ